MRLGIDRILEEEYFRKELSNRRLALVAHPASVTSTLKHSLDALREREFSVVSSFGPQHGMRGEKQENMIESDDYFDPVWKIPVHSLYGQFRRPTPAAMKEFDVLLFDLQDIGCRIYTYLTTLVYLMEECEKAGKELWVLDRPNPAGRPIEGNTLEAGWETFVGAVRVPMRHGLTLGELALWTQKHHRLSKLKLKVVEMKSYDPTRAPGYGWPEELSWVNASPNIPTITSTRAFCGTVLLEGTNISEARGTTRPLEMMGASWLDPSAVFSEMKKMHAPWLEGCVLRTCAFEPMFHKEAGKLCHGFQIHVDGTNYSHEKFLAFRLANLFLKAVRKVHGPQLTWRPPPYEYENIRLPVDILNGSDKPRLWVDDPNASFADFERYLVADEKAFREARKPFLLYKDG